MKVAIIGAGFTGLAAAYKLSKDGIKVTVFEREDKPGGLAIGFKEPSWKWAIEKHYHHWFTSDWPIRNLADEIETELIFKRVKTSTLYKGSIYQLDSPPNLLKFPHLSVVDRFRTGLVIAYLRYLSSWKPLEGRKSEEFIRKYMGDKSWQVLWEPLYRSKFRSYANDIPTSWFWARIKKRSALLGYPEGGFQAYANALENKIRNTGNAIFHYDSVVTEIKKKNKKIEIHSGKNVHSFDKVICTLPFALFVKLTPQLSKTYKKKLLSFKGIGAVNLILSLKNKFFEDNTYWLNVNDDMPYLAVVEHTNLIEPKFYNNERLLYVGNYLEHTHPYYEYTSEKLLNEFIPHLRKINPKFSKRWVNKSYIFKALFAQPIPPLNYSRKMPKLTTPVENLYLANLQQIHPWDRGTNYSVELGEKVAELVIKS